MLSESFPVSVVFLWLYKIGIRLYRQAEGCFYSRYLIGSPANRQFGVENSVLSVRRALLLGGRAEAGPEEGLGLGEGTQRMAKAGLEAPQPVRVPAALTTVTA